MLKNLQLIFNFISLFILINNLVPAQTIVAGYYQSWNNLPAPDKMEFNNLTHVIQAFAYPNSNGTVGYMSGVPSQALIQAVHFANRKILLSFGGQSNSDGFGTMTADSNYRKNFITNVVNILSASSYDGIDIDWEYPTGQQAGQLTTLVIELRQKFNSVHPSWLITMAVPPTSWYGQNYQYEIMYSYIDWFSIMAYGYHGSFSSHSGHNAPLYPSTLDNDGAVSSSVGYMYFTRQVPRNKLLLGIPFFGIRFTTSGLYKPFTGSVPELGYKDAISTFRTGGWNYNWDTVSAVPWLQDTTFTNLITFEDTMSVRLKTDYVFSKSLGGIMIWALDHDIVDNGQPLLESIGNSVRNHSTRIAEKDPTGPTSFYLYNSYPNPFNPLTTIKFSLDKYSEAKLIIYDVLGRKVKTLINGFFTEGIHSVIFEASNFPSGIYFYILTTGTNSMCKKMILIK